MKLKTVYELTISTLSPLHIGSGETLEKDFDYVVHKGQTWALNQEQVMNAFLFDEAGNYVSQLQSTPPGQLLRPADFEPDSGLFRYVIKGTPQATRSGSQVQAQIKNVFDELYFPGSSLKGALRTVIFRAAFARSGQKLNPSILNNSRYWAGQKLERDLLGRDPNHDLLRALHVGDSGPIATHEKLVLLNAQVMSRSSGGAPIALECVRGDVVFHSKLALDEYLFTDPKAHEKMRFDEQQQAWLHDLPALANEQAEKRIQQELAFYRERPKDRAAVFYQQLAGLVKQMPAGNFLLQVGWGGGWDSKTLAYLVPAAEKEALIQRYNLVKGQRSSGQPFPKSRRAIARGGGDQAQAVAPLGWLLVNMKAC